MTTEKEPVDTGGPAFPFNWETKGGFWAFGLTVRDYMAVRLVKTLISDTEEQMLENAIRAYKQADALLKARDL